MARTSSLWSRRERAAVQAVEVRLDPSAAAAYRAWAARAAALPEAPAKLLRFAEWYGAAERAWLDRAAAAEAWAPDEPDPSDREYCRSPAEALGHTRRGDGLVLHLVAADDGGAVLLHARFCRAAPAFRIERRWTEDQRLSWGELVAGYPCKGCGRPVFGSFEHKPTMQRTPEEAALHDAEEAAFLALHPDCRTTRWSYGSTGLTHCSACCPPPPFGPEQSERIARILVEIAESVARRDAELTRRWQATQPGAAPAAAAGEQLGLWPPRRGRGR